MKSLLLALVFMFPLAAPCQRPGERRWTVPSEFKQSVKSTELASDQYLEGGCSTADTPKMDAAVDDMKYRHAHLRVSSDFEEGSIEHLYSEITRYVAHVRTVCMQMLLNGKDSTMQSGTWTDHLLWKSDLDALLDRTAVSE